MPIAYDPYDTIRHRLQEALREAENDTTTDVRGRPRAKSKAQRERDTQAVETLRETIWCIHGQPGTLEDFDALQPDGR